MGLEDLPEICYPEIIQKDRIPVFEKAEISFKDGIELAFVIGKSRGIIYLSNYGEMIDGQLYIIRPFHFADISNIIDYKKI